MLSGPYNQCCNVSKSDSVNIPFYAALGLTDALFVSGAGDVVAVFQDDTTATFTCDAGTLLPIAIKRVDDTGTDATGLVALYRR